MNAINGIKVFKLNEYEWYAGRSLEECIKQHMLDTGLTYEDAVEDPYELTDDEMDKHQHLGEEGGEEKPLSFRDYLRRMIEAGETFPSPFATTEH